jgi:acetyl-CoA synthetase
MERVDDVLNISAQVHRLGSMQLESAFESNSKLAKALVVGVPHGFK